MKDTAPPAEEAAQAADHIVVNPIQPDSSATCDREQSAKALSGSDRTSPLATPNAEAVTETASSGEEDDTVANPARDDLSDRCAPTSQLQHLPPPQL